MAGIRWRTVLACLIVSALSFGPLTVSAEPAQSQEYLGPGTYVFPGAADATSIVVADDIWGDYWCYGVERNGADLHVTIGIVLLCIEGNLNVVGPATTGTIVVA